MVTFVEYWEDNPNKKKTLRFSWITDLTITEENIYQFMRGARARWKIENETFNTLKNQGYQFGHNFGLGKKTSERSVRPAYDVGLPGRSDPAAMLSFIPGAWKRWKTKRSLWEKIRFKFQGFMIDTMEDLYRAIIDHKLAPLP